MNILQVSILEELGRGTSGIVYKVRQSQTGKYFVVKTIDFTFLSDYQQTQSLKEVDLLKQVNHPHIIKYHTSLLHNNTLYILMDFAAGGDLQKKLNRYKAAKRHLEEAQIWQWAYEIALGLKYLHKNRILHRDIKCLNIFLDKSGRVKIGDLGLSKILNSQELHSDTIGTPLYLSPEQVRHQPYGLKVDVWGLGCVVYTLCTFESPFQGDTLLTLGQNIVLKEPKAINSRYSAKMVDFVSRLLEKSSKKRPGIREVINLVPLFTKKMYRVPVEECDNEGSDNYGKRCFSLGINKEVILQNEIRPVTREGRLLIGGADIGRMSTSLAKCRPKEGRHRTTISDLEMLN